MDSKADDHGGRMKNTEDLKFGVFLDVSVSWTARGSTK